MDSETAVFVWRMVLLSMSSFLSGSTLVISIRYYFAWLHRDHDDWRGLLPLHVFTVVLSYDLLLIYATLEILIRIGDHSDSPTWRGALLIPAYILGFIAMYSIAKLRKKRRLRAL